MSQLLKDKVAIITGASQGLGRSMAKVFSAKGARLAVCARNTSALEELKHELEAAGGEVVFKSCDVFQKSQMGDFVDYVVEHFGRVDILVNNAMNMPAAVKEEIDDEEFTAMVNGGLHSTNTMMNLVMPVMRDHGGGVILNMTSIGGLRGLKSPALAYSTASGYAAAKAGIVGLSRSAANHWADYKIRVNCVAPMGMTETWRKMLDGLGVARDVNPFEAGGSRSNALGYAGEPDEDIAPVCAFLCSDEASYVTGCLLPVDGGLHDLG